MMSLDAAQTSAASLDLNGISAGYGKLTVLDQINFSVPASSVVALVGANGAGKTTLLNAAAGLVHVSAGTVSLGAEDITHLAVHKRPQKGLCLIPEEHAIFRGLTVRENLWLSTPPWVKSKDFGPAIDAFPVLGSRLSQTAGTLSGGEQRMLAVARAYLSSPRVILVDELSIGLAPVLLDQMFESVQHLARMGVSMVIVEQYVDRALTVAEHAYILVNGRIAWNGASRDIDRDLLESSYLGGSQ
jgi:branched-chain amino acid transport system ATP-binding protein